MKSKLLIWILLISVIIYNLIPIKVSAETFRKEQFEKLSIDDGLSNEYVTKIFQDSKGYMWIGTVDGLNRYDGERIKIYNSSYEDKNSLSSTYITEIEEDLKGNLWIGTDRGLDFLVRDKDNIVRMKDLSIDKYNLGELKITSLLKSSYDENIMWVGTENGLMKIDIENEKVEAFYNDKDDQNSLTNSYITCLEEGKDNTIWVGTKDGINIIDKNSKIVYSGSKMYADNLFICHIEIDNLGNVWISTNYGILNYNIGEEERDVAWIFNDSGIKQYDLKEKKNYDVYTNKNKEREIYNNNYILSDSKNNIWIASSEGVLRYSNDRQEFDILKKDSNGVNSLNSNVITYFYEDFNGTIWIGTDKGVNILNNNNQFDFLPQEIYLSDKNIVSILQDNQYIWLATKYNGIYIFDKTMGNLVDQIYKDDSRIDLSNQYIKSLFKINDENILIITDKRAVLVNTKESLYAYQLIEDSYYTEINYVYSDGEIIWLASTADFYSYNIITREKLYYSKELMEFDINPGHIKYILPDYKDKDILWLGGIDIGVVKYHKEKGVIEQYTNKSLDKNSLISNYINCMTFDNSGNLWIGTNIGLSKLDIKTNKFTSYTTADGLTNNFINSILIDNNDNLWISTNKGLNKFDIKKEELINFTRMDGLYGYQFNLNSSIKLNDGMMIFGSTNGFSYFYPDDIVTPKSNNNEVVIGDIYIGKDKVVYDGNNLVLNYKDKNLSIDYFVPNYENLNNITYEYMIEGIDSDWIYIDSKSNLDFKLLEPGNYILKIRARNGHGELTKETSINIRVKNPIWKTPFAYLVYIFIIIIVSACIIYYVKILQRLVEKKTIKLNKQLEENKKLSEEIINKEKLKNNYFVNLSHELRTPINVISSTVQLINTLSKDKCITEEQSNKYMNIISKNCGNLLKIINDIIDSSKIETGQYKINKKNNDIVYIVEEAALNMSEFIEEKGLTLTVDPDMEEKIISCDGNEIERCVINLLANAVKFTPEGGEIRVYIKEIENNIEISVEDTGIGISKEDQGFIFKRFSQVEGTGVTKVSSSGIGLTLVKYIVELHDGYVKLESELNKGSKFTLVIPAI
ncbi:sensor histidine kinase [Clostridium sp.]|uniref:sensor histidine kinase n=1 Tax=Clostridium sp. TaxID=1506 RepID=UPI0025BFF45D|nr:sensor histidine kinase [Clostridium sp.]